MSEATEIEIWYGEVPFSVADINHDDFTFYLHLDNKTSKSLVVNSSWMNTSRCFSFGEKIFVRRFIKGNEDASIITDVRLLKEMFYTTKGIYSSEMLNKIDECMKTFPGWDPVSVGA